MFQSKLYRLLSESTVLKSLKDLLTSGDSKVSQKAWELVLKHGMPVDKDGGSGDTGRTFHLHMNVPRPDQPVAIDVTDARRS